MTLCKYIIKSAFIAALTLELAACGKQEGSVPGESITSPTPITAADCDKLPDPRPLDESAAGKARALMEGQNARELCKKTINAQQANDQSNADLARIRAIKEKEEAEREASRMSAKEASDALKKGSAEPLRELKF